MCKELPPATAGLSGTTRRKARLNRSTPCARRRGGGYRTEPIPFACRDERGCHLPTSQRSRSITQIKAGPFCQGSTRFQFPARRHRLSSQFASWDPSRRRYRWLGRKFPLGTDFLPYLPSTKFLLAKLHDLVGAYARAQASAMRVATEVCDDVAQGR